ncbi:8583_t:CDS:2, partial [Racocetra persica]
TEVNEQEGLPTDVASILPLMLQAQDLVSKLESRVYELENDLEVQHLIFRSENSYTINEAHEHERDQLLQEIGEKDEYIHNLKTKASRLEFGAREAIIDDDDNATAVESNDLEGQFLDSIKLCLNYLKCTQNNQQAPKYSKKSLSPVRRDSKLQPSNDDDYESDHRVEHDPLPNNIVPNHDVQKEEVNDDSIENDINNRLTVHHNSSRRESFSGSQISLDDVSDLSEYDLDGSEDIADYDIPIRRSIDSDLEEGELERREQYLIKFNNHETNTIDSDLEEGVLERREQYLIKFNNHETNTFHNKFEEIEDESTDVDQHVEERAYLKRDLSALALSLAEEQTLRSQIQTSKESLEQEIDDWINAMFEKVNQMVFDEANTREELECLNRETKGKMDNSLKSSESRQDRLREMKLLLVHLDSTKQRQTAPTQNGVPLNRNSIVRRSLLSNSSTNSPRGSRVFGCMSPNIFSSQFSGEISFSRGRRIYIDSIVYEEFQEYVKSLTNSTTPTSSTPTHPFMKRCMNEDIQPCLFEGHTGWKSPFYKRRLLDAIMKNQCEIQKTHYNYSSSVRSTPNTSQISSSTSNTRQSNYNEPPQAPKQKCGLCGHLRSCDFRMRIFGTDVAVPPSTTTTSSSRFSSIGSAVWIPLDRFCRDRIVAVCDFYTYISHLRKGLLVNSPVWGMYKQCLKYRRRMSMARVGSVSMFEEEDAIINECLNNSEMEGMVVLVN